MNILQKGTDGEQLSARAYIGPSQINVHNLTLKSSVQTTGPRNVLAGFSFTQGAAVVLIRTPRSGGGRPHTRGTAATCTPGVHFLVLICAFLMSIKNFRNGIPLVKAASQHHGYRNGLSLVKSKSPTCEQFPSAFINPVCSEIQQTQPAAAKSSLCAIPQTAALGFSRQEHWSGSPFPSPMHKSQK